MRVRTGVRRHELADIASSVPLDDMVLHENEEIETHPLLMIDKIGDSPDEGFSNCRTRAEKQAPSTTPRSLA